MSGRHPPQAITPSPTPPTYVDTPVADTYLPPGRHPLGTPPETATAADGTHPSRMHSCLTFVDREIEDLEKSSEESSDDDDDSSAEQDEDEEIKAPNELLMEVRECFSLVVFVS